jgi:hypothetical protein
LGSWPYVNKIFVIAIVIGMTEKVINWCDRKAYQFAWQEIVSIIMTGKRINQYHRKTYQLV